MSICNGYFHRIHFWYVHYLRLYGSFVHVNVFVSHDASTRIQAKAVRLVRR
uniref:Uncharacterized protein n=1 Tax=Anguilla anguilla TaxID=7936 RepID=A0A0E9SGR7_ANGAN